MRRPSQSARRTSCADLRTFAEQTLGRGLVMVEVAHLQRSSATAELCKLSPEILAASAQKALPRASSLDLDAWLRAAVAVQQSRRAAARSMSSGPKISRCTRCGSVLPAGAICNCAAPENSGRPGA